MENREFDAHADEKFMKEALKEAHKAYQLGEVPIGAVLVYKNQVVFRAHNQVEMLKDATAHAEMLCLSSVGAELFNDWRLTEATLYTTLEPCPMCVGAMFLCRIKTLVWGAPDVKQGASGGWVNLLALKHPFHTIEVRGGVLEEHSATLLKDFFKQQRKK